MKKETEKIQKCVAGTMALGISASALLKWLLGATVVTGAAAYGKQEYDKYRKRKQEEEWKEAETKARAAHAAQQVVAPVETSSPVTVTPETPKANSAKRYPRYRSIIQNVPTQFNQGVVSPDLDRDQILLLSKILSTPNEPLARPEHSILTGVSPVSAPSPIPEDPDQKNKSWRQRRKERIKRKEQSNQLQEAREIMEKQMRRFNNTERTHQLKKFGKTAANIAFADAVGAAVDHKIESTNDAVNDVANDVGVHNLDGVLNPENLSHVDKLKILAREDFPDEDFSSYTDDDYKELYSLDGYEDVDSLDNENEFNKRFSKYSNIQRHLPARNWDEVIDRLPNSNIPFWQKVDDVLTHGIGTAAYLYKFGPYGYGAYGNAGLMSGALWEGVKE